MVTVCVRWMQYITCVHTCTSTAWEVTGQAELSFSPPPSEITHLYFILLTSLLRASLTPCRKRLPVMLYAMHLSLLSDVSPLVATLPFIRYACDKCPSPELSRVGLTHGLGWVGLVVGRELFLFLVGSVGSWVWNSRFAKKRCRVHNYM